MFNLSRATKVGIMLGLSSIMFFVELVVGVFAGSLTLIADSFHMLNDVLGMVIALWAIKVASSEKAVPNNTFGWQRAEILGALTNGVLLLGLCLTIYIDAIERFISIEVIKNPMLVMIVGCVGLTFNLMGLVLFHDHGHAHAHGHGHGHSHIHDEEESVVGEDEFLISNGSSGYDAIEEANTNDAANIVTSPGAVHSSAVANRSIIGVPHPIYTQQAIINSAREMQQEDQASTSSGNSSPRVVSQGSNVPIEITHQDNDQQHGVGKKKKTACNNSSKKKKSSSSHSARGGDSHGEGGHLNMRGVWLHVFGDCITNVAVIISGLVIWLAHGDWRYYFDPAMSLVINSIIVFITIPLVKSASFILLNGVPSGVDVDSLRKDLKSIPNVMHVHDLHVWQLSDTKNVASVHVLIDRPSFHQCIHNSNSSSAVNIQQQQQDILKSTKSARLISRNPCSATLVNTSTVDMDCVYMDVAAKVKHVMHRYGIHATTIQPEFVVGQAVSVDAAAVTATNTASGSNDDGSDSEREGSIFSRVEIAPDSTDSLAIHNNHRSGTIGPCLLSCREDGCKPGTCCPGENPIKVVSGDKNRRQQK